MVPPGLILYILTVLILFLKVDNFPSRFIEKTGGVTIFSIYWKSSARDLPSILLGRPVVLLTLNNVIALSCWKLKCLGGSFRNSDALLSVMLSFLISG